MQSLGQWTRNYFYNFAENNFLQKHDENEQISYLYDAHGNMLKMPHLQEMKSLIVKILTFSLFAAMIILSYYAFHPDGAAIFSKFSGENLVILVNGNFIFAIVLLSLFFFTNLLFLKIKKITHRIKIPILCLIFVLWLLNCRTFALILYPEGRISSGWFCMETDRFFVCSEQKRGDCETAIYQQTKIEKYPFWFVKIQNADINKLVFIGPFLWHKSLTEIDKEFYLKGENQLSD